jgi:hypothetical protein
LDVSTVNAHSCGCCRCSHAFLSCGASDLSCIFALVSDRYYVEDHSNQLVRTFTGNLTKMLSQMPGSFKPGAAEGSAAQGSRDAAAANGSSMNGGMASGNSGSASGTKPGEWSATRLVQVCPSAAACVLRAGQPLPVHAHTISMCHRLALIISRRLGWVYLL